MARRYVELCRRIPARLLVSTVASEASDETDRAEAYEIDRQPFTFACAKKFVSEARWSFWLQQQASQGYDLMHCGNLRPLGTAALWAHRRTGVPYLLYVNGHDVLKATEKAAANWVKRRITKAVLENAAGIVATSDFTVPSGQNCCIRPVRMAAVCAAPCASDAWGRVSATPATSAPVAQVRASAMTANHDLGISRPPCPEPRGSSRRCRAAPR